MYSYLNMKFNVNSRRKRLNVVDLKANHPEKFGRFIMALRNLIESADWPRICGIHGDTFKPDDAGVLCPTDPAVVTKIGETGEPFYCKHSVYSFIGWHTPYVYQFELLLNKHNKSSNRDYICLPWLDLTDFTVDFSFLNAPEITVFYDKKRITVSNPLAGAYYYVNGVKTPTTRAGFFSPTTPGQYLQLRTVKRQLNNALYAPNYEHFSSVPVVHKPANIVVDYVPLETPHNNLHDIIGGDSGNMSDISISAFDPIFWLHHCNMDRHYYTWMYNNTAEFSTSIYPEKITDAVWNASCAPFTNKYVYGNDPCGYDYGFLNGTGVYGQLKDYMNLARFPYSYDIIKPEPQAPLGSFIELIDIPIPAESMVLRAYIWPKGSVLDRDVHFAGSAAWFGVNRLTTPCERCCVTRTNIKIDINEYVALVGLKKASMGNYTVTIEGSGRLIKSNLGAYKTYALDDIVKNGSWEIILP